MGAGPTDSADKVFFPHFCGLYLISQREFNGFG